MAMFIGMQGSSTATTVLFQSYFGNAKISGVVMLIGYLPMFLFMPFIKKIVNKIEEILLWIILIPIIIIVKVYLFFSWVVRKLFKRTKPKEESLEDRLYNLMENHLGCKRQ